MARASASQNHGWQGITAHPLFGTLVQLWFAVTFALSSLAISGAMIERIVLASQIDLIIPMATPPLGIKARLILALGFGVLGAVLGWMAARVMAPARAADDYEVRYGEAPAPLPDTIPRMRAPMRAPVRAHAELGAQGFDHPFGAGVDLAGPASVVAAPMVAAPVMEEMVEAEVPLVLSLEEVVAPVAAPEQVMAPVVRAVGFPPAPVEGPCAAEKIAHAPLDALSHVELIERLAIVMQRRGAVDDAMRASGQAQSGKNAPLASAPDGTSVALRAALANLREVK